MASWTKRLIKSDLIIRDLESASVFLNSVPWGKSFYFRCNRRFSRSITRASSVRDVYQYRGGINKVLRTLRGKNKAQVSFFAKTKMNTLRIRLVKVATNKYYPMSEYMAAAESVVVKVKFLRDDLKTYNRIWAIPESNESFFKRSETKVINRLLEAVDSI